MEIVKLLVGVVLIGAFLYGIWKGVQWILEHR